MGARNGRTDIPEEATSGRIFSFGERRDPTSAPLPAADADAMLASLANLSH